MIDYNSSLFTSYLYTLKNRIYKILPLIESNNSNVSKYINSQIFELYGVAKVIKGVSSSHQYVSLLATLEGIQLEVMRVDSLDFPLVRSEIFKCLNLVEKMIEGASDEII